MPEIIGDTVMPKDLIVPELTPSTKELEVSGGLLFISGGTLHCTVGAVTTKYS